MWFLTLLDSNLIELISGYLVSVCAGRCRCRPKSRRDCKKRCLWTMVPVFVMEKIQTNKIFNKNFFVKNCAVTKIWNRFYFCQKSYIVKYRSWSFVYHNSKKWGIVNAKGTRSYQERFFILINIQWRSRP